MAQIDIDKFNKITIAAKKDLEFKAPADGTFNIEVISVASGKKVDVFANDGTTKVKEFTDSTVAEEWLFEYKSSAWAATKLTASTPGKDEKTLPVVKKSKTITVDDTYPTINDTVTATFTLLTKADNFDIDLTKAPNIKRQYTISESDTVGGRSEKMFTIKGTKQQANDHIVLVLNGYGTVDSLDADGSRRLAGLIAQGEIFIKKDTGSSDVDLKYSKFGTDILETLYSFASKDDGKIFRIRIYVNLKGEYYPIISRFAEKSENKSTIIAGLTTSGEIKLDNGRYDNMNFIIPRRSDKMPKQVTVDHENKDTNIYKGYSSPDVIVQNSVVPYCMLTSKDDGKWFKVAFGEYPAKVTEIKNVATPGTTKTITTEYTMSGKFTDIVYVDPSATMLSVEDGVTYKIRGSRSSLVIDVDSNYTGKTFYIDLTESLVTQMILEGITQDWESVSTFFRRDRIAVKVDVDNKKIELLDDKQYFEHYNYTKYPTINETRPKAISKLPSGVTSKKNLDMSALSGYVESSTDGNKYYPISNLTSSSDSNTYYDDYPTIIGTKKSDVRGVKLKTPGSMYYKILNGTIFYVKKRIGSSDVNMYTTPTNTTTSLLYSFTSADDGYWFKITIDTSLAAQAKIEKIGLTSGTEKRPDSVKDISKKEGKSLFTFLPGDQTNFVFTGAVNNLYSVYLNGEGKTGRFMYLYKALGTSPIRVGNVKVLTHADSGKWWKVGADGTVVKYTGAVTAGQMDITKMPLLKYDSPYYPAFSNPLNTFVVRDGYTLVVDDARRYYLYIPSDFKGGNIYVWNKSSYDPEFMVTNYDYGPINFKKTGRGRLYISPYPGTVREVDW